MSDAERPATGADDDFEPVQVFPEADEMDLRPGADDCYKCTTCDSVCPVAEVDDEFPGPKFQGPEQWRLKRKGDEDIDPSVMSCSNCMRCDNACPSSVPLSQMHNAARGEYVEAGMDKRSREYVRNRILANYRTMAELGSKVPRLTNFVMGLGITKLFNETVLGITSEREFPAFAEQTFREWWDERGGAAASKKRAQEARAERGGAAASRERARNARNERARARAGGIDGADAEKKRVAYFHGCYSNYNTPEVGKALVRVFESFGYEVVAPPQRCSGTPMFANGMLADARRAAGVNAESFSGLIEEGYDVIASCTSCSMSLRQEYPELFSMDGVEDLSNHTYEAIEYLRIHEDLEGALADASVSEQTYAYHAPCHARNQGLDRQAVELFRDLDGVTIEDVGPSCSGISGTYGWKSEKYDTSMAIGEEMFEHMEHATGDVGMTECPTCSMQMEHGTGYEIRHPLQVLEEALT
ncbi:anaerobic glycerol-3-phosphate dehydrogenase subunit C [Halegenticoccus tardaugens]|uniref:anaerobic glycerol-3-phosphate dehydrogenase subunit C n=1 Tax=Halegenticoccus tardaugens TaxID=2071624 RepID=UPI00100A4D22|nr:anaerobic glycerol-3-phosphate dehydrogenase subunit C [Halegenticoccus tardaugens]